MKLPQAPATFSHTLRVYWEDTDAGGVVFYANYLKFFERARTEWLRSLGLSQQQLREQTGGMFVVSETTFKYHAPARLDDELLVSTVLVVKGGASLLLDQQALLDTYAVSTPSQQLLCQGRIRIGWVDAASLRPARIPPSILAVL